MDEDNFDIYDDLEHFEIGEKLKEKNEEIESLTERLNLSVVTITELEQKNKVLKKKNEVLLKNTSSLLLTAKLELNRKLRDINLLQEKRENKIFRRPNSFSVAIQTDTMNPTQIETNSEKRVDNVTIDKQISVSCDRTPQIVESCDLNPRIAERCDQTSVIADAANSVHDNLKNFRIPKKNPNARLVDINDRTRADACTNDKLKDTQLDTKDQQNNCLKKYHIPKKNPSARHLDVVEVVSNFTYDDRCVERIKCIKLCDKVQTERQKNVKVDNAKPTSHRRIEDDKDKRAATKVNGRRIDNRKRSPAPYSVDRRSDKDRYFYSDERRCNGRSRSSHKRCRDRDSNDDRDRHAKVFRSRSKHRSQSRSKSKSRSKSVSSQSKPKSSRSESKSSGNRDNKLTKVTESTENDAKCNELEKVENVLSTKVSVPLSKLKDKELEDMLINKTKILEEIVNEGNAKPDEIQEQRRDEDIASEEPRKKICLSTYKKRKSLPLADVSDKLEEERSKDPINSFKEVASLSGPEDNFAVKTSKPTVETILSDVDYSKERPEGSESIAVPSVSANDQSISNQKLTPTAVVPSIHSASVLNETLDDKILRSVAADEVSNSNENITPVAVINLIDSESENLDAKPLSVATNNESNSNEEITSFTVVPSIDSTSRQSDITLPSLTANDQCNSNTEVTPFTPSVGSAFIISESSNGKVAIPLIETPNIENKTNQIENNENSSNGMDIDYELTRRSSVGDELNEQNNKLSALVDVQNDPHAENHQSSCSLINKIPETMPMDIVDNVVENHVVANHVPANHVVADHVPANHVVENHVPTNHVPTNHVPEKGGIDKNEITLNGSNEITLNGSFERHVLSKCIEYTVQDVGDEVHIYLTKKRRKRKKVKVVVQL